jgi:hypothetical protein
MTWKDIMLLLKQTFTSLEKHRVLEQAVMAGNNHYLSFSQTQGNGGRFPLGTRQSL